MSKSIRSYPQTERRVVISRRIDRKSGGLGYWAAVDAQKHQGEVKKATAIEEHPLEEEVAEVLVDTLDS
jgi:hypothetical protein